MSDTPHTDAMAFPVRCPNTGSFVSPSHIEWEAHSKQLERENIALRAHAERLAEALEEATKEDAKWSTSTLELCANDPYMPSKAAATALKCRQAITHYRAENPKV